MGQPYLLSNPDELNILSDEMKKKLGVRYTTHLISLDKCCGDGIFSSDNVTWIFLGYIGVGALLVDLYEWSSRVGVLFSLKKRNKKRDK